MKKLSLFLALTLTYVTLTSESSCNDVVANAPESASGVQKASVVVKTGANGNTTEQNNIIERYKIDNEPGAIKHLYIISAFSGQVLIYSTVKGKVTSSGKRLNPTSVVDVSGQYTSNSYGFDVNIGGHHARTTEVLQDDGTYGNSIDYIYWFDQRGVYHQQYVTGGEIIHVSSQPVSCKSITINMEETVKQN